jgi:HPt (histidine-containing phosphotransfer) domain-containing protein
MLLTLTPSPPPLDLAHLAEVLGDKQLEQELLLLFVTETLANVSKLHQALVAKDVEQMGHLTHLMKGASSQVGAITFLTILEQLERAENDRERLNLFPEVDYALAQLVDYYQQIYG